MTFASGSINSAAVKRAKTKEESDHWLWRLGEEIDTYFEEFGQHAHTSFIHDTPAGGVYDHGGRFYQGQLMFGNKPPRVGRQRAMQGQEIALRQELFEGQRRQRNSCLSCGGCPAGRVSVALRCRALRYDDHHAKGHR